MASDCPCVGAMTGTMPTQGVNVTIRLNWWDNACFLLKVWKKKLDAAKQKGDPAEIKRCVGHGSYNSTARIWGGGGGGLYVCGLDTCEDNILQLNVL